MKPSEKSENIEFTLSELFGVDRRETICSDVCLPEPMGCGKPATTFRDELSAREFAISGFCQDCQDKIFGGNDADSE